jgi:flagellar motor switch protein FliG
MTTLNGLKSLDDSRIQTWLRKIGTGGVGILEKALLRADSEVKGCIVRNMSPYAGKKLQEDLKALANQNVSKREIQESAEQLEKLL